VSFSVNVSIDWEKFRAQNLPENGVYSTIAKFEQDTDWLNTAWSIVLRFDPPKSGSDHTKGRAKFLAENGPHERLKKGCVFEMYEGNKKSAVVTVI
jgi:hypothetical protein